MLQSIHDSLLKNIEGYSPKDCEFSTHWGRCGWRTDGTFLTENLFRTFEYGFYNIERSKGGFIECPLKNKKRICFTRFINLSIMGFSFFVFYCLYTLLGVKMGILRLSLLSVYNSVR